MYAGWLVNLIDWTAATLDTYPLTVKSALTVLLVCTLCGMVGSQVVGNRMAFFSDTMAHSAFAGVALGYLSLIALGIARQTAAGEPNPTADLLILAVMVLFGAAVGAAIVSVRDQTGLANDTIIGVFFAFSIGFGAMLFQVLQKLSRFNPEQFLFGSLVFVIEEDLVNLILVGVVTAGVLCWRYNQMTFASFHTSLARTRRVNLRLNNYLFIVLLALVVNLSIKAVGALLVNALLVVPAATASGVARNLRQMFWLTIAFCVGAGLLGYAVSRTVTFGKSQGEPVEFGPSGTIVVVSVALFFASWGWGRVRHRLRLQPAAR
jgi:zinc transport system permease protein